MKIGKYRLIRKLATGGMAEVFLAKVEGPKGFEKVLVLKRILPHLAEDPAFVEMFLSEARLAAQLNHPNVVQIFDFGEAEGSYYLAMEYIDGPNLRVLLSRADVLGLALPPVLCARIISAACEGLAFAHEVRDPTTGQPLGLIHRDISPDNLLLSRQGALKVVDFGIAKAMGQGNRTPSGLIKGKLAYMPPEQFRGTRLDGRADVYALGNVFYELLTGKRPFEAATEEGLVQAILFERPIPAVKRRPDLPMPVLRILERVLAKDPEQRYPDCHAFQADLEHFILSLGEPVGPWQLAQLVSQVMGNVGSPTPAPLRENSSRECAMPGARGAAASLDVLPSRNGVLPEGTRSPISSTMTLRPVVPLTRMGSSQERGLPTPAKWKAWLAPAFAGLVLFMSGSVFMLRVLTPAAPAAPVTNPPDMPGEPPPPNPGGEPPGTPPQEPPKEEPAPDAADPRPGDPTVGKPGLVPEPPKPLPARVPGKGIIGFIIRPFATVVLDGRAQGVTPFVDDIEVSEGWHTVRFVNHAIGKDVTERIEVRSGRKSVISMSLFTGNKKIKHNDIQR